MYTKKQITLMLTIFATFLFVCIGIFACVFISKMRMPPNLTINGCDVSTMDIMQAKQTIDKKTLSRNVVIQYDGKNELIPLDTLGCKVSTTPAISAFITKSAVSWLPFASKNTAHHVSVQIYPDDEKLSNAIDSLLCTNDTSRAPENAKIIKKGLDYVIKPDRHGSLVDKKKLFKYIKRALEGGITNIQLENSGVYEEAAIKASDQKLAQAIKRAELFKTIQITMHFDNKKEVIDWSVLSPLTEYKNETIILNHDKLQKYLKTIEDEYDTFGKKRKFKTSSGKTIMVGGSEYDNYGYKLDKSIFNDVTKAIDKFKTTEFNAKWEEKGLAMGENDFGDTYIEVSIPEQHLWYYRNGKLVFDTEVVTGTETVDRRKTPRGVFQLLDLMTNHTMTGSYGSAFCHYCLVVTWEGICIHDATWRDEFGGDIYEYDGSHGCINVPLNKMEELYNMEGITYGVPIIIY